MTQITRREAREQAFALVFEMTSPVIWRFTLETTTPVMFCTASLTLDCSLRQSSGILAPCLIRRRMSMTATPSFS